MDVWVPFRCCTTTQVNVKGLLREVHAAAEGVEARVGAQWVEPWIYFQVPQVGGALLIRFFQPSERLLAIAQTAVDNSNVIGLNVALLR